METTLKKETSEKGTNNMNIKFILSRLSACAIAVAAYAQEAPGATGGNNPLNAVVKLEVSTAKPDIFCPWANRTGASSGSGVVIAPGRILTCAHCVTDACYIRVRKHNEDTLYHGAVEFIDNDADLAFVKVKDSAFMNGVMPMEIGDTPRVQDDVLAVGYPVGGEDISYTRGIVSRIEDMDYAHSQARLLGIQVDAAINPGNSGGPEQRMLCEKPPLALLFLQDPS